MSDGNINRSVGENELVQHVYIINVFKPAGRTDCESNVIREDELLARMPPRGVSLNTDVM